MCSVHDKTLREKLLRTENLTLDKCIKMCRLSEITAIQLKTNDSAAAKKTGSTRFTHPKQGRTNQSQGRAPPGPRKRMTTRNGEAGVNLNVKTEIVAPLMARTVMHVVKEFISSRSSRSIHVQINFKIRSWKAKEHHEGTGIRPRHRR